MVEESYLHGYTETEQNRLYHQALYMEDLVYSGIDLSSVKNLLEVGSGVGAQSEILLRRFPRLFLTGIDFSEKQIAKAKSFLSEIPHAAGRFELLQMDAEQMNFPPGHHQFDGAFLCWVLEHVPHPEKVLAEVKRVLQPYSKIVVTEVLNTTLFVEPYSPNILLYWKKFNDWQYDSGGDPYIGAKLGTLLKGAGFKNITTNVISFHADSRDLENKIKTIDYWTELLLSGAPKLIEAGYIQGDLIEKMKEEFQLAARDPEGVFFCSFIQAQANI